jgi:hypothetical protein
VMPWATSPSLVTGRLAILTLTKQASFEKIPLIQRGYFNDRAT